MFLYYLWYAPSGGGPGAGNGEVGRWGWVGMISTEAIGEYYDISLEASIEPFVPAQYLSGLWGEFSLGWPFHPAS